MNILFWDESIWVQVRGCVIIRWIDGAYDLYPQMSVVIGKVLSAWVTGNQNVIGSSCRVMF